MESVGTVYVIQNHVIRWKESAGNIWTEIRAPWNFLAGSRDIDVLVINNEKGLVLVFVNDDIWYCILKSKCFIKHEKLLDKEFHNLLGVAYDTKCEMVYFLTDDYFVMIELNDLIPLNAKIDELVNGYVREMEIVEMFDCIIPPALIELIVSYYPIGKI